MLKNTIVLFTTDNGGPAAGYDQNAASNYPLRGVKSFLWEGAIRGAGFIWSPLIKRNQRVEDKLLIGIQDWLPTLYEAAGTLFRNKRFALNEMFQRNASKFAILYICLCRHRPGHS